MFFDRESTVVITKLNNSTESVLTAYCQNFGKVLRCFIKTSTQTPKKDPCKSDIVMFKTFLFEKINQKKNTPCFTVKLRLISLIQIINSN